MQRITSIIFFLLPLHCYAINVALDKEESIEEQRTGWLPYAFRTDSLGTAAGIGYFSAGRNQPQSGIVGTGYVTDNDSQLLMGAITNFQLPGSERMFFDAFALGAHFTDQRFYVTLTEQPGQPRTGTNDSTADNFVKGISDTAEIRFTLKYPLAIGNSRKNPISVYRLDRGLLHSGPLGGKIYDPLLSGKTVLAVNYFHLYRDLAEINSEDLLAVNTNGIQLWLDHNNTDFPRNPSSGSRQKLVISRGFGWVKRSTSWTNLELEASKYINLGKSSGFRQRVLAINFWTSTTSTWETDSRDPPIDQHRPPPGRGSSLGGYDRLRAYPIARFRDKSAVYYSAELRMVLGANPFRDLPLIKYFEIDWMQIVGFVEAGRVGPGIPLSCLLRTSNMMQVSVCV